MAEARCFSRCGGLVAQSSNVIIERHNGTNSRDGLGWVFSPVSSVRSMVGVAEDVDGAESQEATPGFSEIGISDLHSDGSQSGVAVPGRVCRSGRS